jgi:hypothetical protein
MGDLEKELNKFVADLSDRFDTLSEYMERAKNGDLSAPESLSSGKEIMMNPKDEMINDAEMTAMKSDETSELDDKYIPEMIEIVKVFRKILR